MPPGVRPPFPPPPFMPPGMGGMGPPPFSPPPGMVPPAMPPSASLSPPAPGMSPMSVMPPLAMPPPSAPAFVPASNSQGAQPAAVTSVSPAPPLALPNPSLAQTNPSFKKATELKWANANFSPVSLKSSVSVSAPLTVLRCRTRFVHDTRHITSSLSTVRRPRVRLPRNTGVRSELGLKIFCRRIYNPFIVQSARSGSSRRREEGAGGGLPVRPIIHVVSSSFSVRSSHSACLMLFHLLYRPSCFFAQGEGEKLISGARPFLFTSSFRLLLYVGLASILSVFLSHARVWFMIVCTVGRSFSTLYYLDMQRCRNNEKVRLPNSVALTHI